MLIKRKTIILKKVEWREMKVDAVSQCASIRMDMQ